MLDKSVRFDFVLYSFKYALNDEIISSRVNNNKHTFYLFISWKKCYTIRNVTYLNQVMYSKFLNNASQKQELREQERERDEYLLYITVLKDIATKRKARGIILLRFICPSLK